MTLLDESVTAGQAGHLDDHDRIAKKLNESYDVVADYGADPTGAADATVLINAAIADRSAAGGGAVEVPDGIFLVEAHGNSYCLAMADNVHLRLAEGATIKMKANQPAFTEVVAVPIGVENWTIRGGTIDGNQANQGASTDDRHGIRVEGANRGRIKWVRFRNCDGDGIYLGFTTHSTDVEIRGCDFDDLNRNGITIGGADNVLIKKCHFGDGIAATAIDGESPSDAANSTNVEVAGNTIEANNQYAITTTGNSASGLNSNWKIHHNTLLGGSVDVTYTSKVKIHHNEITGANLASTPGIQVGHAVNGISIHHNTVTSPVYRGIYLFSSGSNFVQNAKIHHNVVSAAAENDGIRLTTVSNAEVSHNDITGNGGSAGAGVYVLASIADVSNVKVTDNTCRNFSSEGGIRGSRSSTFRLKNCILTFNIVEDTQGSPTMTTGISLAAADFIDGIVMHDNIKGVGVTTLNTHWTDLLIQLGGYGARPTYSGTGTPEAAITASIGAMFLRRDGGAGTTLYVKESGTGNTGWVGK